MSRASNRVCLPQPSNHKVRRLCTTAPLASFVVLIRSCRWQRGQGTYPRSSSTASLRSVRSIKLIPYLVFDPSLRTATQFFTGVPHHIEEIKRCWNKEEPPNKSLETDPQRRIHHLNLRGAVPS